ncbi:TetR/AcrR family transcriptional regulator [Paraglaciecola arctica]|uniref:TetR/AcrR family transcriptional regulator n=1 Tax=Paraglaciecola arctica TaxID=1128911 RepID=UPI001C06810A|nr:TetR/AcrR family transcriptional regulator [Paraglaciecola arctica]MBU3004640.1 TetR/AcrR family transcriptional regulator [Paraglaciecola arctica]
MSRRALTTEEKQQVRETIKQAASKLAEDMSLTFEDTQSKKDFSVRKIAKEAGISIGTFYKYFDSVSELAKSMWSEPVEELNAKMKRDFDNCDDPALKVRLLLEHYVRFSNDYRRVFRGAFLFVRPEKFATPTRSKVQDEPFFILLCQALEDGQQSGDFRDFDISDMAKTLWAGIHGALALPVNMDTLIFDTPEGLASHMLDSLIFLVKKH